MATPIKLSQSQIGERLPALSGFSVQNGKLHKEFRFPGFVEAFGFMAQVALVAERTQHHPEWFNVYNRVVVELTTHDAGGISEKDFELAKTMNELAGD